MSLSKAVGAQVKTKKEKILCEGCVKGGERQKARRKDRVNR